MTYSDNRIIITSDVSYNTKVIVTKVDINSNQKTSIKKFLTSEEKRKNRIIITGRRVGLANNIANSIYIHKYNLKNNIKFIFRNNDFNKPRILFIKSDNVIENEDDLFLFDNSNNFATGSPINILDRNITPTRDEQSLNFNIYLNFYKNYTNDTNNTNNDYYNFKLSDFSLNSINSINSINVINDYSNNKLLNNYSVRDFSNLYYYYDSSISNINNYFSDLPRPSNIYESSFNFLLYNKPSANNITSKTSNNYTKIVLNKEEPNNSIYFLPFKKYDYYSNKAGKILFYNNCIHFNSLIIDSCSNFYSKHNTISPYKYYDSSNTIFLSLGNFMTGFTQKNLFKQTKFELNDNNNINKISFVPYYEPPIPIPPELSNNYLIDRNDYSYNYIFDNILYTYTQNIKLVAKKNINLNLIHYYYNYNSDFSKNIYLNAFNNYNIKNSSISSSSSSSSSTNIISTNYDGSNINFNFSNLDYDNNYNLTFSPDSDPITSASDYNLNIDFRYNYDVKFPVNYLVNINYNDTSIDINNINFFKIDFLTYFDIVEGSIFNNVDCVFIRYDPYNDNTPTNFRYPNNNIDICRNFSLDFLNTVIENTPGARTSTTNVAFIPEKNSSNYSKKMIEGLIGYSDTRYSIPKLLAIKPYDESILIGRGFNNQLNFQNGTLSAESQQLSDEEIVNRKYESQKYNAQKTNKVFNSRQRFASLARTRVLNRNINPGASENCINKPPDISSNNYVTPFRFFKTAKGNYLRSGR